MVGAGGEPKLGSSMHLTGKAAIVRLGSNVPT